MALPSFDDQVASMDSLLLSSDSGFGVVLQYVDANGQPHQLSVIRVSDYEQRTMVSRADKAPALRLGAAQYYEVLTSSVAGSFRGCVFTVAGVELECSDIQEINDAWSLMALVPKQKITGGSASSASSASSGGSDGSWVRDEN